MALEFDKYHGHQSSVTDLDFSTSYAQLASGGAEGSLVLWNIQNLDLQDERIVLRHMFHSVNEINYVGERKVAVVDLLDLKVVSNGVKSQWELLKDQLKINQQSCPNAQQ